MSSELERASAEAVAAQDNAQQLALIQAVLKAQQLAQPVTPPAPVQQSSGGAAKWLAIGIGGSFLAMSLALSAMAVAISAVALTCCLLVLRSMWTDRRPNRRPEA